MKYSWKIAFLCSALFCTACSSQPTALSSERVLSKAGIATKNIESMSFSLRGMLDVIRNENLDFSGRVLLEGAQDALQQSLVRFSLHSLEETDSVYHADMEVFSAPQGEMYVYIHQYATDSTRLDEDSAGVWWRHNDTSGHVASLALSQPSMVADILQHISVVHDRGLQVRDDQYFYHYDIELQPITVATEENAPVYAHARGQLWINGSTFFVEKIVWDIESIALPNDIALSGSLEANFSDHNMLDPLLPPQSQGFLDVSEYVRVPFLSAIAE